MSKYAKRCNTEVKVYIDHSSRSPYVVAVRFSSESYWRPLQQFDEEPAAERYFHDLLKA